jgi:hypothetical protein
MPGILTAVPAAGVHAVFPDAPRRAGMYESFYLRAVAPDRPLGVWVRYTVHKRAGQAPRGSVWCTVFDGARRPFQHKLTTDELSVPAGGWIAVGDSLLGPGRAEGSCGEARWALRFASLEPTLRHLPQDFLYRAPLPRTKLTSPAPAARFEGTLELPGTPSPHLRTAPAPHSRTVPPSLSSPSPSRPSRTLELDGWHGMVGHNWGTEHAERWIWLHGLDFAEDSAAWLDVALGRVRVAGCTTPWVATGALHLDGTRHRLGGLGARRLLVAERPEHCLLALPGAGGLVVEAHAHASREALAGWRYADPDGAEHDVSNCSIAALTLTVRQPGRPARTLRTAYGAAYELGMREHDHGVPLAPFPDG